MPSHFDRLNNLSPPAELDFWRAKKQLSEFSGGIEVKSEPLAINALAVLHGALRHGGVQRDLERAFEDPEQYVDYVTGLSDGCVVKAVADSGMELDTDMLHLPSNFLPVAQAVIDERIWDGAING